MAELRTQLVQMKKELTASQESEALLSAQLAQLHTVLAASLEAKSEAELRAKLAAVVKSETELRTQLAHNTRKLAEAQNQKNHIPTTAASLISEPVRRCIPQFSSSFLQEFIEVHFFQSQRFAHWLSFVFLVRSLYLHLLCIPRYIEYICCKSFLLLFLRTFYLQRLKLKRMLSHHLLQPRPQLYVSNHLNFSTFRRNFV
jgi:hypothetical protein